MMRWNGFGRSVAFAAVAGLGFGAALLVLAPVLGATGAIRLLLIGSAALYGAGLAPRPRQALAAGLVGSAGGALLWLLPLGVMDTALGAAAILALVRSGLLYRARPLRGCLAEIGLQGGGLALAAFLAQGSALSLALGVWGYFLVQSVFFLIGGVEARARHEPRDPFDRARAELLALLR
jgi:hypothetical protein